MTKPKNMTPEQEAEWKAKDLARRATPEYKAKAALRAKRWYEKDGNKEKTVAATAERRKDEGYRERRNELERAALAADPDKRLKAKKRHRDWLDSPEGREKSRQKSLRYYQSRAEEIKDKRRADRHFAHFLKQVEAEEAK